jgi:hypothetical protein
MRDFELAIGTGEEQRRRQKLEADNRRCKPDDSQFQIEKQNKFF